MLNEVCIAGIAAFSSDSASVLCAELTQRCALNIPEVRDGYDHLIVSIKIFCIKVTGGIINVSSAFITIFIPDFDKFVANDRTTDFRIIKY